MDDELSREKERAGQDKDIGEAGVPTVSASNISMSSSTKRNVRLVYCSDGVVEECDEDLEEQRRLEKETREKELEERQRMDLEAKNLPWIPWMGYMTKRTAVRTLEACDYAGEKLAWWLGITKPKFMYEISEYEAMMREQEKRFKEEDPTEEIVIGSRQQKNADPEQQNDNDGNFSRPNDVSDAEMRLYEQNETISGHPSAKKKPLFQN